MPAPGGVRGTVGAAAWFLMPREWSQMQWEIPGTPSEYPLSQLMAQSSLGKDSGYSRLGADLLFEYNKAVMKNSARLSMLQLRCV